eukprot:87402-Prymnesium_polylepis.2
MPFLIRLTGDAYEIHLGAATFDNSTAASEVWIVGDPSAADRPTLLPMRASEPLLVRLASGSPRVHFWNVRLLGGLRVEDGELDLVNCVVDGPSGTRSTGINGRAVVVVGGYANIRRTVLRNHSAGAISVDGATLSLVDCTIQVSLADVGGALHISGGATAAVERSRFVGNRALISGGAVHVSGASNLTVAHSTFTSNHAHLNGGAIQVDGAKVSLLNETLFLRNSAPDGGGGSIHLSESSTLHYRLPAPPGRWLSITQGVTWNFPLGAVEDLDFPYACPAGVVGGSYRNEQLGPGCSRPW